MIDNQKLLENGIQRLAKTIHDELVSGAKRPVIVLVAGGSASGKTSIIAERMKKIFELSHTVLLLSMDDYYCGVPFMDVEKAKGRILNWDEPDALELSLLRKHLMQLKSGQAIEKPIYDFKTGTRSGVVGVGISPLQSWDIVIVEGLFALHDKLVNWGDVKVFVDIGVHGRIVRRILRDVQRTGQEPQDILHYFAQIVEPMHELHVQSTISRADIVIPNEYSPRIEAEKSGLHTVQGKFKVRIDHGTLRRFGVEVLNITDQSDYYYNPPDRDLMMTGEIMRIRHEGGRRILTYKGPDMADKDSLFSDRAKFEFEIDSETEQLFLEIYRQKIRKIQKTRILCRWNGVVFSLDHVYRADESTNWTLVELGDFLEIRADYEGDVERFIGRFNLQKQEAIKRSYFEM